MNDFYRRWLLLCIILLCERSFIWSQDLVFDQLHYDFGDIVQEKGQVLKHSFHYTNNGNDTLYIISATSGIPSITCDWNRGPIKPESRGYVNVSLKTSEIKGDFNNVINVRSNDTRHPYLQISVSGKIIPKNLTIEDRYPVKLGFLRMKKTHLALDNFQNDSKRKDSLEIYNAWDQLMSFDFSGLPDYLKATAKPAKLLPGQEGVIVIEFDAQKSNQWGLSVNAYRFSTNEPTDYTKTFTIGVNIIEDFSKLSKEEKENAPKIKFNERTHHFGKISGNDPVSFEFEFTNEGKSDLIIRKTKASCGCTSSQPSKTVIKPGETANITITFNPKGYSGKQSKMVTVICNDPESPVNILSIEAEVGS